jgi:hypothetical protein
MMNNQILNTVLKRYLVLFLVFVIIAVLSVWVVRGQKKWIVSMVIVCAIGGVLVFSILAGQIIIDFTKQDYVMLENSTLISESATIDNIGGCCSVTIVSEDGLEFGLLSSTIIDAGTYKGTVVYAKRSKLILYLEMIAVH